MNDLAAILACDPSNVTGLVDRLVVCGLVEHARGRRYDGVKRLLLTDKGAAYRIARQELPFTKSPASGDPAHVAPIADPAAEADPGPR